jgi:azurin
MVFGNDQNHVWLAFRRKTKTRAEDYAKQSFSYLIQFPFIDLGRLVMRENLPSGQLKTGPYRALPDVFAEIQAYRDFSVVIIGYSILHTADMFKFPTSFFLLACLPSFLAHAVDPIVKADRNIEISTLVAQMKYDRVSFSAKPGEILRISLNNPDDLPHNLVVCKPAKGNVNDKGKEVADAVVALGVEGVLQNWIPLKHPRLLAHTDMINPKEEVSVTFLVPKQEGPYPFVCTFPGHAQMMNGVMIVSKEVSPVRDLSYQYFQGTWDKLPDWNKLEPEGNGTLPAGFISLDPKKRKDKFGFLFKGRIEVPKDGEYEFFLTSDDGSELLIDGNRVVLNDGVHGMVAKQGKIKLKKGLAEIKVGYFQKTGGEELRVAWKGPGFNEQPLTKGKPKPKGKTPPAPIPVEPVPGEAVIYRNFIDRAGPRAIGVGYSEGLNLAFDANVMRLAIIWRGAFINGQRHWTGRGQGFQAPAGEDAFYFPNGAPFARLESLSASWPPDETRASAIKFGGYRFDDKQRPTFIYYLGKARITDYPKPSGPESELFLVREITIEQNGEDLEGLVFRAGIGTVEKEEGFVLAKQIMCRVEGAKAVMIKKSGNPRADGDLRVPVKPANGRARIKLTYSWI